MFSNLTKRLWVGFTKSFGTSIIHPQSLLLRFQREAIEEARKYARGKLVDIGCGRMPYRKDLEQLVDEYVGVDHPQVSKLYHSNVKPDVIADAKKLPFPNNTFDIALLFQVLEHVDSPRKVVAEAARVLKPNGVLIISVPFLYPLHDMPYDWARYTSSALQNFVQDARLSIVKINTQGMFFEFWLQLLNTFLIKLIFDIIKAHVSIQTVILVFLLCSISIPIILVNNLLIILVGFVSHIFPKYPNYFPLGYLVIAKKKDNFTK